MNRFFGFASAIFFVSFFNSTAQARIVIHPDQVIDCLETHSSDSRISHQLFGEPVRLLYTGTTTNGLENWGQYDESGVLKFSLPLAINADGFTLGRYFFREMAPLTFEAKLIQRNGSPLFGTFDTEHTVVCQVK